MNTSRWHRFQRRIARQRHGRITRLRLEQLESRLALSLMAEADVPGELLVGFQAGLSQSDIADFYRDHGLTELTSFDFGSDKTIKLVAAPAPEASALIATLEQDARVRYAEPNFALTPAQVPNDPTLPRDWGFINNGQTSGTPDADIDADEAWDITTGSSEIVVAVIDSGADYDHPDLAANMWHNPGEIPGNKNDDDGNGFVDDYYGYDFVNKDGDPMDDLGHGTHVSGTIGMAGNNGVGATGVNWNVKIMALKSIGADNFISLADAMSAYSYVLTMKNRGVDIRVTNNSYGGFNPFIQSWKDAIDAMGQAGILFIACAHNQAVDIDNSVDGRRMYPAAFDSPSIISVAATDHNDRYASFTNWGATSVDLAAPGWGVWSTVPKDEYEYFFGTSMATPHAAGAAALVWSAFPDLTAQEVKARLLNSVDPIGHIGANASYPTVTNGRLNVRNALLVPVELADSTAPAAVNDLAVSVATPWSVALTWSATGDDGGTGRGGYYDVRYSSFPITESNWDAARPAAGEPAPRLAGSSETFIVTGLDSNAIYYFAVRVKDNAGNVSALSNIVQGNTTAANVLFRDDMESDPGNWTAAGLWHPSALRAHDSPTAWYYGQDSTRTYYNATQHQSALTLATAIDLTGASQALLSYDEWRQVIDLGADLASVQVSRNGSEWTTLSETFLSSIDWETRTLDLTPFVGGPVYLRFYFNTNPFGLPPIAITQGREGWFIDNVEVLVPGSQAAGFTVSDVTLAEGHDGTTQAVFTVTRSSSGATASVQYATADGSATAAAGDYGAVSGTLVFAAGETRKSVAVPIYGDRLGEAVENFVLNLTSPTGAVIVDGQGRAVVVDDEPRIHADGVSLVGGLVFEQNATSVPYAVAVNLTTPSSQTVTVNYATADGTALAGSDYLPVAGTLTFNPGETRKIIPLTVLKDSEQVPVQAFFVNLSNASSNAVILRRAVIQIVDLDALHGNHYGYRNRLGTGISAAGSGFLSVNGDGVLNNPIEGDNVASPFAEEPWAIADKHGNYVIEGVGPGEYAVRQILPDGWTQTTFDPDPIFTASGQDVHDIHFGSVFDLLGELDWLGNSPRRRRR